MNKYIRRIAAFLLAVVSLTIYGCMDTSETTEAPQTAESEEALPTVSEEDSYYRRIATTFYELGEFRMTCKEDYENLKNYVKEYNIYVELGFYVYLKADEESIEECKNFEGTYREVDAAYRECYKDIINTASAHITDVLKDLEEVNDWYVYFEDYRPFIKFDIPFEYFYFDLIDGFLNCPEVDYVLITEGYKHVFLPE